MRRSVDVMVGVDVSRLAGHELAKAVQLPGELAGGVAGLVERGRVVDEVKADRQPGMLARQRHRVRAAAPSTIRLVLVTIPVT